jgi:microcystin-dependent protein
MANPFLGEIRMFGFGFAPKGWATCSGQFLSIQQNAALFSLLGTTYGGNGTSTFQLPDLRGRTPVGQGQLPGGGFYTMGEIVGSEGVQLLTNQIPIHNHLFSVNSGVADVIAPTGNYLSGAIAGNSNTPQQTYAAPGGASVPLAGDTLGLTGGNQAHSNMQPYLVTNYCIALQGIFPSRN